MRRRFLFLALAYCLFMIALCLFPPFGDGHHHSYQWHPSSASDLDAVADYVGTEVVINHTDLNRELRVSMVSLGIEAALGLLAILAIALLVELAPELKAAAITGRRWIVGLWREFRKPYQLASEKKAEEEFNAAMKKQAKAFRENPENQEGVRLIRPGNEDPFLSEQAKPFNASAAARPTESEPVGTFEDLLKLDPKDVKGLLLAFGVARPTRHQSDITQLPASPISGSASNKCCAKVIALRCSC